jgi:hypothetical protein
MGNVSRPRRPGGGPAARDAISVQAARPLRRPRCVRSAPPGANFCPYTEGNRGLAAAWKGITAFARDGAAKDPGESDCVLPSRFPRPLDRQRQKTRGATAGAITAKPLRRKRGRDHSEAAAAQARARSQRSRFDATTGAITAKPLRRNHGRDRSEGAAPQSTVPAKSAQFAPASHSSPMFPFAQSSSPAHRIIPRGPAQCVAGALSEGASQRASLSDRPSRCRRRTAAPAELASNLRTAERASMLRIASPIRHPRRAPFPPAPARSCAREREQKDDVIMHANACERDQTQPQRPSQASATAMPAASRRSGGIRPHPSAPERVRTLRIAPPRRHRP